MGFDRIDITPEIEETARAYVNDLLALVTGDLNWTFGDSGLKKR